MYYIGSYVIHKYIHALRYPGHFHVLHKNCYVIHGCENYWCRVPGTCPRASYTPPRASGACPRALGKRSKSGSLALYILGPPKRPIFINEVDLEIGDRSGRLGESRTLRDSENRSLLSSFHVELANDKFHPLFQNRGNPVVKPILTGWE